MLESTIMLKAITIENFKSFHKKQSLPLAPLTLMIGAAKKVKKEGTSFGDLTIIKEFEKACIKLKTEEVWIWSLDSDLKCHHQNQKQNPKTKESKT